jgi:serine/threonine-protein kinase
MLEEVAGGGDWAKVLDFGIAKIQQDVDQTDPGLTAPNLIIGTPQYMSPEQCSQASRIDARSDIYSFGVILFEMLAGHVPFTGDSPTAIMMKHLQEPPPSVLDERKDLPAGVGRVVARALAKRPEDRFQKAGELADALAAAATEEAPAVGAVDTDRIVIPTAPNEPARQTFGADDDEATVVSARHTNPSAEELPPPVAPLPESNFSPWRIAVPAIALLVIVFAVVFAFQRRGASSSDAQQPTPLQTDPNGQPLQSITPPTGQAERNIAPATQTPTPILVEGAPPPGNVNAEATPTPKRGKGNQNQADENANENQNEEQQETPTPTPRAKRPPDTNINVSPPPPKQEATPENPPQRDDSSSNANVSGPNR